MASSTSRNIFSLTVLLFLGVLATVTSAARSAGCGKSPSYQTGGTYTLNVNNKQRQYMIKLPNNYDSNKAHRLIFTWHQLGGSAQKIVQGEDPNRGGALPYYGLAALDTNNDAIFVVPQGLNSGWGNQNGEDVTFFDQMVSAVENALCVETSLRFSTGFSYGGAMSHAVACARPTMVRAIAVISGAVLSGCSGGNTPVAYYGQHGTADSVLNVGMGRQIRDQYVRLNGCQAVSEPQPNGNNPTKVTYQNCRAGYPATWVIHNGDHNPSQRDSSGNIFAPGNTWQFFSQFSAA